jgi:hypothetical protein
MIDIENKVYTQLRTALNAEGITSLSSVYLESPAAYPHVFIEMINNSVDQNRSDSGNLENFAKQDFQIEIFTNGDSKKTDAKEIANIVDGSLNGIGLRRSFYSFVPNYNDNNISRLILRYTGLVDKQNKIYGGI